MNQLIFRQRLMTARILCVALSFSVVLYVLVLQQMPLSATGPASQIPPSVFPLMAGAAAFASIVLRRLLLARLEDLLPPPAQRSQPAAWTPLLGRWFVANVLSYALNEGVALAGFLLALQTHESQRIYPYAAMALVLNLLMFPRYPAVITENLP